jgi:hypothetical protein
MLTQGATCTMEAWPAGTAPHSGGTVGRTWSHPWCAGPISVVVQLLVGVQPLAPGWRRFEFAPQPSNLTELTAAIPVAVGGTPGTIDVTVAQSASAVETTLTVPAGTTARVCLPAPHGLPTPATANQMWVDGVRTPAVSDGRLLCLQSDLDPGGKAVSVVRRVQG